MRSSEQSVFCRGWSSVGHCQQRCKYRVGKHRFFKANLFLLRSLNLWLHNYIKQILHTSNNHSCGLSTGYSLLKLWNSKNKSGEGGGRIILVVTVWHLVQSCFLLNPGFLTLPIISALKKSQKWINCKETMFHIGEQYSDFLEKKPACFFPCSLVPACTVPPCSGFIFCGPSPSFGNLPMEISCCATKTSNDLMFVEQQYNFILGCGCGMWMWLLLETSFNLKSSHRTHSSHLLCHWSEVIYSLANQSR